jgi:hypothetical protein
MVLVMAKNDVVCRERCTATRLFGVLDYYSRTRNQKLQCKNVCAFQVPNNSTTICTS